MCSCQDHPRVCGEKLDNATSATINQGSPPRMRGKAKTFKALLVAPRITPAYAGKSRRTTPGTSWQWDHPRVCGEKMRFRLLASSQSGSPPRMRGKERGKCRRKRWKGITPAYAGKSFSYSRMPPRIGDHPRVCGEKLDVNAFCFLQIGSPPRMRGKVLSFPFTQFAIGITPAYAGKRLKRSRSTVSHVAIVPLFPSVCNKPVVSDGSPAGRDAPLFLPAENAVPASPAYNLRSL